MNESEAKSVCPVEEGITSFMSLLHAVMNKTATAII
jgi:hypothetical protein